MIEVWRSRGKTQKKKKLGDRVASREITTLIFMIHIKKKNKVLALSHKMSW